MKCKRTVLIFILLVISVCGLTACSSNNGYILPTFAPTYTPMPDDGGKNGPTPTPPPDASFERVISLDGEDYNQTSYFTVDGVCHFTVRKEASTGRSAFYLSDREDTSMGMSLNFTNTDGVRVNVVDKVAHIAAWVFQETGENAEFTISLTLKKPDSLSDTPTTITIPDVPSHQWTLLEYDIPIFANITNPSVAVRMTSSTEPFYMDDVRLTYDKSSQVGENPDYSAPPMEAIYFDFEDYEVHLDNRGDATAKIADDDASDGDYCLFVENRTANWNGAQIDLSPYRLAGKKIWVMYSGKHEDPQRKKVICTIEYVEAGTDATKYANVASTDLIFPNRWASASGAIDISEATESLVLYFETEGTEDFYVDDILISTKDPAELDLDNLDPDASGVISVGETVERIDTSRFKQIHYLTGDNARNEAQLLTSRGSAETTVTRSGHSENGFMVSGRSASWNGVGLDFTDLNGDVVDVVGKELFVSYWVYQNSGETLDFSATLQVNKPNGDSAWPERVTVEAVESGKWTYAEGIIPVYGNVAAPQINFELPGSDTASFVIDDITVMYDPSSVVADNPDYVVVEQQPFTKLALGFEDNDPYFQGRGNGKPSIVYGGHESEMCMAVSGRIQSWHGVQADLSAYALAGKTVQVTYWVYHEYDDPLEINMSAEQNDGATTTYTTVILGSDIKEGKWAKFTNTFTFAETAKKYLLYFESPNANAEFFVDDVLIEAVTE